MWWTQPAQEREAGILNAEQNNYGLMNPETQVSHSISHVRPLDTHHKTKFVPTLSHEMH